MTKKLFAKNRSLWGAFTVTAITCMGQNFHHPVTPTLFTEMSMPSRIFGNSFAIMCFTLFLSSPLWGELCNRLGRMKVYLVGCIFYGLAQYWLSQSTAEMQVLLARAMAGFFTGAISIGNMLYIVDISKEDDKAQNMVFYTALSTVSSAIGYLIGGLIGVYSYRFAIGLQAYWMITLGVVAYLWQEESYTHLKKESWQSLVKEANPFRAFLNAGKLLNRHTILFFGVVLFTGIAGSCYDNAFNYFLKDQLGFHSGYNGVIKAVIGILSLIANYTITSRLMRRGRLDRNLTFTLVLCALTAALALVHLGAVLFLAGNFIFYIFNSVYQQLMRALSLVGRHGEEAGILSGLYSAVNAMGNVGGALIAGGIYAINVWYPFICGVVAFGISAFFCYSFSKGAKS
ncbi:MAG: MFS transporter [Erysipelotrichaceae bacterium]|nr:MFS transporter [Erysipelotrichaceae bacterium]